MFRSRQPGSFQRACRHLPFPRHGDRRPPNRTRAEPSASMHTAATAPSPDRRLRLSPPSAPHRDPHTFPKPTCPTPHARVVVYGRYSLEIGRAGGEARGEARGEGCWDTDASRGWGQVTRDGIRDSERWRDARNATHQLPKLRQEWKIKDHRHGRQKTRSWFRRGSRPATPWTYVADHLRSHTHTHCCGRWNVQFSPAGELPCPAVAAGLWRRGP
jgi:hypothetical protein